MVINMIDKNKDVTWVEEPEIGFWEATFLPAIIEGLKTTLRHVGDRKTGHAAVSRGEAGPAAALPRRASAQSRRAGPREVRGLHAVRDGVPGALHRTSKRPTRRPTGPTATSIPATFVLDELRCIYCGMCEEACPVDAIELTHIYDLTGETREPLNLDKEKLLDDLRRDEGQPQGPGADGRGRLGPASEFARAADARPGDAGAPPTTARRRRRRPA